MSMEQKAKRLRRVIAVNMVKSWQTSPKCDYLMKVNAEPMMVFRKSFSEANGVKVDFLNLVMKAAATALKEFPYVNSSYDSENHVHRMHEEVNVGFVISVDDGLLVTNTKGTDRLDLTALSRETERLIEGSKNSGLNMDDITGGTFTINNMGTYKRLVQHTAIINQPELAILSMYAITDEPAVRDGAVVIQKSMNLMLSADHRVIDGKMACDFLTRIVGLLENPESLTQ
ncbi:MAG: 2-oxo acid dehydrogenase subunit E2 [Clostridia bacterium]|nr:2-oxo acid dehydrogenase subunit E2 [Clostridia bacterium]